MTLLPIDIALRLLRKGLPASILKRLRSTLGRAEAFRGIDHPYRIARNYFQNVPILGKDVLEIGPGHSITTAVLLLSLGANRVFLMERMKGNPFLRDTPEYQAKNVEIVLSQIRTKNPEKLPFKPLTASEAMDRIIWLDTFIDDGTQIARVIPDNFLVDTVVSTLVLEHVQSIPDSFANMNRFLRQGGSMYHLVDLTDHLYHFASKYQLLNPMYEHNVLSHYRYSERAWKVLDSSSLHMNRVLLPEYLSTITQLGLRTTKIAPTPAPQPYSIHTGLLSRVDPLYRTQEWLQVRGVELVLEKGSEIPFPSE